MLLFVVGCPLFIFGAGFVVGACFFFHVFRIKGAGGGQGERTRNVQEEAPGRVLGGFRGLFAHEDGQHQSIAVRRRFCDGGKC